MPIPIHVGEIKKLIIKDQFSGEETVSEDHLLNVLNSNSSGKNPTFFKAFGHNEVFGLKNFIPDGGTVVEKVAKRWNADGARALAAKPRPRRPNAGCGNAPVGTASGRRSLLSVPTLKSLSCKTRVEILSVTGCWK